MLNLDLGSPTIHAALACFSAALLAFNIWKLINWARKDPDNRERISDQFQPGVPGLLIVSTAVLFFLSPLARELVGNVLSVAIIQWRWTASICLLTLAVGVIVHFVWTKKRVVWYGRKASEDRDADHGTDLTSYTELARSGAQNLRLHFAVVAPACSVAFSGILFLAEMA